MRWTASAPASAPECEAFLLARGVDSAAQLAAESAELAALAIWGGNDTLEFADGSVALSRRVFDRSADKPTPRRPKSTTPAAPPLPPRLETVHRHLVNAGLLSLARLDAASVALCRRG